MPRLSTRLTASAWLFTTLVSGPLQAQYIAFDGETYESVGEAISRLTPDERVRRINTEALKDQLVDMGVEVAGEVYGGVVSETVPAGALVAAGTTDQVKWVLKQVADYVRTMPDNRPWLEQLMDKAGVAYGDIPGTDHMDGSGPAAWAEYNIRLLEEVQYQLMMQQVVNGDSYIPDERLLAELEEMRSARELFGAAEGQLPVGSDLGSSVLAERTGQDAGSGAVEDAPAPPPAAIPDPDPNNMPEIIDWVLRTHGCKATEEMIFAELQSRFDMWSANIAIVNWTESPSFSAGYRSEQAADGSYVYRKISGPYCS